MVVTTMASVAVDLPVAPAAPMMTAPVFVTTVAVPVPATLAVSARRAAPVVPLLPALAPTTPVALPVAPVAPAAPVALDAPAIGPSSSDAIVQNEKFWFTCNLPVYLANTVRQYQRCKSETKLNQNRVLEGFFFL